MWTAKQDYILCCSFEQTRSPVMFGASVKVSLDALLEGYATCNYISYSVGLVTVGDEFNIF